MSNLTKVVVTASGKTKTIIAITPANMASALSIAQAEIPPVNPDINNKADANKRYKDLN